MKPQRLAQCFLLFWLVFHAVSARADLTFTTEFRRAGYDHDPNKAERVVVTYIKGDMRRVENTWSIEGSAGRTSSGRATFLVLGAQRQKITLYDDTKTYSVAPLKDAVLLRLVPAPDGKLRIVEDTTPPTKTAAISFSVKDLGEETICGIKTRHYGITHLEKLSDSSRANHFGSEVWVALGLDAELKNQPKERLAPVLQAERLPSPWFSFSDPAYKTTLEGGGEIYNQLKSGFIMRSRTRTGIMVGAMPPPPKKFTGGEIIHIREVTSLSRVPLDDSRFSIPPGYREVPDPDLVEVGKPSDKTQK